MALFDCFTFFNELDILDIRFKQHDSFVDKFVIVESKKTFTGLDKTLFFEENKDTFKKYLHKIIHIIVDELPESQDPFVREHYQRNMIQSALKTATAADTIIISDVDEIIREDAARAAVEFDGYVELNMPMFQFYLNLMQSSSGWSAPYAFKHKYIEHITQFQSLSLARWTRNEIIPYFESLNKFKRIMNSGWHFTHLGGIDKMITKFQSYSHFNDLWPQTMSIEDNLQKHILSGGCVGNFYEKSRFVEIKYPDFPLCINNNQMYYKEIGFIKDIYEQSIEANEYISFIKKQYALECLERNDNEEKEILYHMPAKKYLTLFP